MAADLTAWGYVGSVGSAVAAAKSEGKVETAGMIPLNPFRIVIGIILGAVILSLGIRTVIRTRRQGPPRLDDGFVLLSFVCFVASASVLIAQCRSFFGIEASALDETFVVDRKTLGSLQNKLVQISVFRVLSWTALYSAKGSFLALFHSLVGRVSRAALWYFWFVASITAVCWAFATTERFMLCPSPALQSSQCNPVLRGGAGLGLEIFIYVLDVATDALIISIPVIVLRKACISRGQKLGVVIVLCLAAAAVVAPIIGLAVYLNYRALDVTWITFWLFAEGAIWLIMTCVLSFRALFVKASDRLEQSDKRGRRRLFRKTPPKELPVSYLDPITPNGAPSTPQHSIRSHFKRRDSSIGGKSTMQSQADMGDLPPLPLKGNEIYVSRVFQIQSNRATPEV